MNYNDNGIVKPIVVKAGDTLPVGTIVEFDGTTIPAGYEQVEEEKDIYSSEEVKTNKVWIDGKPIYRKTYHGTTTFDIDEATQLLIPASVNVDKIINYSGYVTEHSGRNVLTVNDVRIVKVSDNKVLFQSTNNSLKNSPYAITFEYTKTTD